MLKFNIAVNMKMRKLQLYGRELNIEGTDKNWV